MSSEGCKHRNENLDPERVDGTRTICYACKRVVTIIETAFADGKSHEVQFEEMREKLNEKRLNSP